MSDVRREGFPARPYLPPSFFGALGCVAGAMLGMELAWRKFLNWTGVASASHAWPIVLAVIVAFAVLFFLSRIVSARMGVAFAWAAACLALSLASSAACGLGAMRQFDAFRGMSLSSCVLTVEEDPSVSDFGVRSRARVSRDGVDIGEVDVSCEEVFSLGTSLEGVFRLESFEGTDWDRSRFMEGSVASVRAVRARSARKGDAKPILYRLREVVLGRIDPASSAARALVAGTVCGYAVELNGDPCSEAFSRTGLSHLVAVSGSHLALIAGFCGTALRHLGARRLATTLAVASLMGSYVVFTGGAPSAVRSFIMVCSASVAGLGGRRGHAPSALSLTVVAIVVLDPGVAYDLGFQLSAVSVLFICLFSTYISFHVRRMGSGRAIAGEAALTLGAQWGTAPLTISTFGQLSLVSPISNLMVAPVMTALLAVGVAVVPVSLAVPDSGWLFAPAEWIANVAIFLATAFARVPLASVAVAGGSLVYVACWGTAFAAYMLWRPLPRRLVPAVCALAAVFACFYLVRWSLLAPPSVVVMDVGQADGIIVRDGSSTLLVDTGAGEEVLDALQRNDVTHVDAVLVTHWHDDHYGGLPSISAAYGIGSIYVAEGASGHAPEDAALAMEELGPGRVREVSVGDSLRVGRFRCSIVSPKDAVEGLENEDSVCLKVTFDSAGQSLDALLTGDAEAPVTEEIARSVGDIDVLKLGHHGSEVSVSESLLAVLQPEVCVASAGEGNSYGHPDPVCTALVEASGARMLCTKDVGDVSLEPAQGGVRVRCRV